MMPVKTDSPPQSHVFVPKEWCYPLFVRNLRLAELIKRYVRGVVLDYGCAGGKRFRQLKDCGPRKLIAFDLMLDPEALSNRGSVAMLMQADGRRLPFADGIFDCVVANHVIEHIDDIDSVLCEIQRVLAPGGRLLVGIPTFSTSTLYMYYPLAYALYYLMRFVSRRGEEGGNSIAHGKRIAMVADRNALKVTKLFESILLLVPTEYLKTALFSWGFTMWGAQIINNRLGDRSCISELATNIWRRLGGLLSSKIRAQCYI